MMTPDRTWTRLLCGLAALVCLAPALAQEGQTKFASPEEAAKALLEATQAKDRAAMEKIFGSAMKEFGSGDATQDAADFAEFAARMAQQSRIARDGDDRAVIEIGLEAHPFAVPLVRKDGTWFFDTAAGKEELDNRRIGENELGAIRVCRGYVVAQFAYFSADRDGDNVLEFAQRVMSSPGARDGLYWDTTPEEAPSPIGPAIAAARAEGYGAGGGEPSAPQPYHGYVYRILTRQAGQSPGGAFDYVINGNMVAGFALLAYPVEWDGSGVMTFLVNTNGQIFQKDLGEKTTELAGKIQAYEIDSTWSLVKD
jgi:hypothetical protein